MTRNTTSAVGIDASTTNYCGPCGAGTAGVTAHAPARRVAKSVMGQTNTTSSGSDAGTALVSIILLGGLGAIAYRVASIAYFAYVA